MANEGSSPISPVHGDKPEERRGLLTCFPADHPQMLIRRLCTASRAQPPVSHQMSPLHRPTVGSATDLSVHMRKVDARDLSSPRDVLKPVRNTIEGRKMVPGVVLYVWPAVIPYCTSLSSALITDHQPAASARRIQIATPLPPLPPLHPRHPAVAKFFLSAGPRMASREPRRGRGQKSCEKVDVRVRCCRLPTPGRIREKIPATVFHGRRVHMMKRWSNEKRQPAVGSGWSKQNDVHESTPASGAAQS